MTHQCTFIIRQENHLHIGQYTSDIVDLPFRLLSKVSLVRPHGDAARFHLSIKINKSTSNQDKSIKTKDVPQQYKYSGGADNARAKTQLHMLKY